VNANLVNEFYQYFIDEYIMRTIETMILKPFLHEVPKILSLLTLNKGI